MKTILTVTASFLITLGIFCMAALSHREDPAVEKAEKAVTKFVTQVFQTSEEKEELDQLFKKLDTDYLVLAEESAREGLRILHPYLPNEAAYQAYAQKVESIRSMPPSETRWKAIADILEAYIVEIDNYTNRKMGFDRTEAWLHVKYAAPAMLFYNMEENLKSLGSKVYMFAPAYYQRPTSVEKMRADKYGYGNLLQWELNSDFERQRLLIQDARSRDK